MSITDELERLEKLKENGSLSEEEFDKAKQSLLQQSAPPSDSVNKFMNGISSDVNLWSMLIHLSQFLGFLVPLAGWIVPIVLWQVKKDDSPVIDRHGRIVTNWIISELIYLGASMVLTLVFIGIPLLLILIVVGIIFPIVGGIKANNGEFWPYPCSIKFFPEH